MVSLYYLSSDLRRRSLGVAQIGIDGAGFLPGQHVQRFYELSDAVDLGAEQPELDDLLVGEMPAELSINLVAVDRSASSNRPIAFWTQPASDQGR